MIQNISKQNFADPRRCIASDPPTTAQPVKSLAIAKALINPNNHRIFTKVRCTEIPNHANTYITELKRSAVYSAQAASVSKAPMASSKRPKQPKRKALAVKHLTNAIASIRAAAQVLQKPKPK